jgi:hypothetical protein
MRVLLLFIFIIFSCKTAKISEVDKEIFFDKNNAIVVLKIKPDDYYKSLWCETDGVVLNQENCIQIKSSNHYSILSLKPAKYELAGYETFTRKLKKIDSKYSNITKKRLSKPLIIFNAKKGQISYIGEIKKNGGFSISFNVLSSDFDAINHALVEKNDGELLRFFGAEIFNQQKKEVKFLLERIAKNKENFIKDLSLSSLDLIEMERNYKSKHKLEKTKMKKQKQEQEKLQKIIKKREFLR